MEEQREESEFVGDYGEPMEEAGKGKSLSSKTETLIGEDVTTVEVSDSGGVNPNDRGSATEIDVGSVEDTGEETNGNVEKTISSTEAGTGEVTLVDDVESSELSKDAQRVSEVEMNDETAESEEVKGENGVSHGSVGDEETIISAVNEVTDEKAEHEVEDNGAACDAGQNAQTEKTQQSSVDGEMLSGAEDKADQEKESTNEMGVDTEEDKEEKEEEETNEGHLGTVSEVGVAAEINDEENGEAMEIDYAAEEQDVKVGGALDNACNESAGASVVQIQDVPIAEADVNDSNVVKEMETDEGKDNVDMATDLTQTIESADLANPTSPTEDAATGEVEPVDHNALFDPSSDITNFIDFSGVSSWSGNIQDLKTETRDVSLKEDTQATDMAEEVATVGIENEPNEARVALESKSPAAATTDFSKEASDATLGSENNQEDKDLEGLDKKTTDEQDTMREEDDVTHEAPNIDPNQKEDTEMEENPNNSDYEEAGSDIKTNGVKRKADVLTEDSPGEGRKTVSFAKVSFAQRPSFKIGACIARAASQMAGSPSVLKGSNFGDETLSVESFVSQLHCAATDPVKEHVVSEIAAGFFLDFRNLSALQQAPPEKVSNKRGRPSNSNVGGTEAFEFEEMGDTYWTDRVIHNGGEEQTPPTEKEDYQVVPVELKSAQVPRTRRPYRRRQSQISIPLPASDKPANFDENAPAELIMKFSEADTIPPEKSLSKMFRHFGPIRELQTEVDKENNRARVVYRKGTDAEVAYNSAGRFSIFGTKAVNYELSYTITETFKVRPYVVSLGEEDAAVCLTS
ncbi:PWWP domain-containing protein 5 [Cardamine amara subsp. amara]|uniref:PWWP domain-containing protein 5 n=1 Tax=Cardamine amara subsp. amara TaxID=228776 RepID=A0ABD1B1G8_CARAN